MRTLILDVSRALANPGQSYPFEGTAELPEMDVLDDVIRFEGIRVKGTFTGSGESVSVLGEITARVNAHCARCMAEVSQMITVPVNEVFTKTPDPNDPDLYPLNGHTVEFSELVKDALLLEMPMRFVCGEDCKGLCPVCGVNRNVQRCTCQEGGTGMPNPFSALSEMLSKDEEV